MLRPTFKILFVLISSIYFYFRNLGGNLYRVRFLTYYDRQWDEEEQEWTKHENGIVRAQQQIGDRQGPIGPAA